MHPRYLCIPSTFIPIPPPIYPFSLNLNYALLSTFSFLVIISVEFVLFPTPFVSFKSLNVGLFPPLGADTMATFVPFSSSMGDVISAADLIVSRAGAGSIAEIIRCRAPSILVPYPHAADDHQMANALSHEQHGAGISLSQDKLNELSSLVIDLIFNDEALAKFKSQLERLDRFDSSERIANDLLALCNSQAIVKTENQEPAT